MVTSVLNTLDKLLLEVDDLPWEFALYIPKGNVVWEKNMKVMVLDPEETEDPDEDPDIAINNGLKYALTISCVQDVVDNARENNVDVDVDTLILSLKYYYENDAFISEE